ncbi:MAG: rod shape-determining protein MreC [Geminicoccaceae bacterium]
MSTQSRRHASRLVLPSRELVERFAFGAAILAAIALLILSRLGVGPVDQLSIGLRDALAPVLRVMSEPVGAARDVARDLGEHFALIEENRKLRQQNARLNGLESEVTRLRVQNEALRKQLRVASVQPQPLIATARVIGDTDSPFVHTRLLDAGSDHGVLAGMAAVNDQGLVGRVIEVGRRSSRLLLLTDLNSRVPVMVASSRDVGIVSGENGKVLDLAFLPLNPRVAVGDRIVTSGLGGVLPVGMLVGHVSEVEGGRMAVLPVVDWPRLDYVQLLRLPALPLPVAGSDDLDPLPPSLRAEIEQALEVGPISAGPAQPALSR